MFKRNGTVANAHVILKDIEKADPELVNVDRLFPISSEGVVDLDGHASKKKPIINVYIQSHEWDSLQGVIERKERGDEIYFPSIRGDLHQSYNALGLWETKLINFKYKKLTTNKEIVHWMGNSGFI